MRGGERHGRWVLLSHGLPETHWPDHLHGSRGKKHPNAHTWNKQCCRFGVFERERARAEASGASGGGLGSMCHSLHSALSYSPQPPTDFSGAIEHYLKCILNLIQMKVLGK